MKAWVVIGLSFGLSIVERILEHMPGGKKLKVSHYDIASRKIPPAFDGCRFVVLSDLHSRDFGPGQEKLLKKVRDLEPDYILHLGDWIRVDYNEEDKRVNLPLARGLAEIAPTYAILGNHEGRALKVGEFVTDISSQGVRLLLDDTVVLSRGESAGAILLTGLYPSYEGGDFGFERNSGYGEDLRTEYAEVALHADEMATEQGLQPGGYFHLVLAHRPELLPLYSEFNFDLVLSGHCHGGLLKLPDGRRFFAPDQGFFPAYVHGPYVQNHTTLVVSEGMGGPRIGIQPEMLVLTLRSKMESKSDGGTEK